MTESTATGPLVLDGLQGLQDRLGTDLGVSSWRTVEQADISTFAKLTGDEQWIHTDPERAKDGPFGATVQHGFLTLGLATGLLWEVCTVDGFGVILNYGLNKVRFPAPVPVGSRVRGHCRLVDVTDVPNGVQATIGGTVEIEGWPKPACVAEVILRYAY
jgi:acyl dehydratase